MSHPPHLTSTWSSAFIPFCAYKAALEISKNPLTLPGITFPLCSAFLPTILEGQLCYELKLNTTSGQGRRNELMFVLDYNEVQSLQGVSAKVHIGTLTSYEHYGRGIFTMTDVKRMKAKDAFLQMPLAQRDCEVELYEDCRTRKLLGDKCKCVPWELPDYKVNHIQGVFFYGKQG